MKLLEERILKDGTFLGNDILKVDNFLNHQIDVALIDEMGKEWARLYEGTPVNKILTVEASGIGIACIASRHFGNAPVLFAKKSKTSNIGNDFYTAKAYSFTHGNVNDIIVSKKYLSADDNVLIIDDFLANGEALLALVSICNAAGATVAGVGIAIEKWYQGGGDKIRSMGIRVESLAKIKSMNGSDIEFV
ncbi:MAG: xanthine phosphoribosyltransferase [Clostridia bacterium]|nr:xanthine phosphoribosyltransferase [Clostridia bacterium]